MNVSELRIQYIPDYTGLRGFTERKAASYRTAPIAGRLARFWVDDSRLLRNLSELDSGLKGDHTGGTVAAKADAEQAGWR